MPNGVGVQGEQQRVAHVYSEETAQDNDKIEELCDLSILNSV